MLRSNDIRVTYLTSFAHERLFATLLPDGTGNTIRIEGSNLKFEQNVLISGTVEKILFEDFEGAGFAVIKEEYKGSQFGASIEGQSIKQFIEFQSKGHDL